MDLIAVSLAWSDQELITTIPRWDANPNQFPGAFHSQKHVPLLNVNLSVTQSSFFPKEPYHWCLKAWLSVGDELKQAVMTLNKLGLRNLSNCIFWGKLSAKFTILYAFYFIWHNSYILNLCTVLDHAIFIWICAIKIIPSFSSSILSLPCPVQHMGQSWKNLELL